MKLTREQAVAFAEGVISEFAEHLAAFAAGRMTKEQLREKTLRMIDEIEERKP